MPLEEKVRPSMARMRCASQLKDCEKVSKQQIGCEKMKTSRFWAKAQEMVLKLIEQIY